MDPQFNFPRLKLPVRQSGVSLIIVLLMLVIIGLTSAAALRNATSGEKVATSVRQQNVARLSAEAALIYCEEQLRLVPAARAAATLAEANIPRTYSGDPAMPTAWNNAGSWVAGGGFASASLTVTPSARIVSSSSTNWVPGRLPECVAERRFHQHADAAAVATYETANPTASPFGHSYYLITARGFSADYTPLTGNNPTETGSVVWLQALIK